MSLTIVQIKAVPLGAESFAPFGDVLEPKSRRLDNLDLLDMGNARMSDAVPQERRADFDVLDYWGDVTTISSDPMKLGYMRSKPGLPLQVSWFERHVKGTQAYIPFNGLPSIYTVAPPNDLDDPNALPDLSRAQAFYVDGSCGINIKPGTWHWTPLALDEAVDFILVVREQVAEDDMNFIDLQLRLNSRIDIVL
jgi:ureidoglycolate lyase